jgi:hypothetical protein
LSEVLELAGQLGKLPHQVVIGGIEVGQTVPYGGVSPQTKAALPELIRRIWSEISRA